MAGNRVTAGLVVLFVLIAGCSGGVTDADSISSGSEETKPPTPPARVGSQDELDWAQALADEHAVWQATTNRPIYTPAYQATLCMAPRIVTNPGPHGEHAYWVYANPAAQDAFMSFDQVPVGGIIIKQKHVDWEDADGHHEPVAIGVMVKRDPGYDSENGDWEYGYITLDGAGGVIDATRGHIATCIDCHANRTETDYLFRDYLPGSRAFPDILFEDNDSADQAPTIVVE